jgi:hypothetical protein
MILDINSEGISNARGVMSNTHGANLAPFALFRCTLLSTMKNELDCRQGSHSGVTIVDVFNTRRHKRCVYGRLSWYDSVGTRMQLAAVMVQLLFSQLARVAILLFSGVCCHCNWSVANKGLDFSSYQVTLNQGVLPVGSCTSNRGVQDPVMAACIGRAILPAQCA